MPSTYKEGIVLLLEGSIRTIPFNIILALLLALDLLYNQVSFQLVFFWLLAIILSTISRWFFCYHVLKNHLYEHEDHILDYFILLTFILGGIWGSCYFLMLPYITILHEFIIILVLGGMSAGSIATLSIYLPAYYAYIVPMLLPVIVHNYWFFNFDRTIMATMFLFFFIVLLISAKTNNYILNQVLRLTKEKEALISELHLLSITDSLTGLYNRRYFESTLQKEWDRAHRNQYSIVLVTIDVDNFKLINDNYGHPSGDNFLIYIAELLKQNFRRANDIICRVGGDEFSVILLNQSLKNALTICHVFNNKFNNNKSLEQPIMKKITLSIGIVSNHFNYDSNIQSLVSCADEALYQAKKEGKNKMIVKELT